MKSRDWFMSVVLTAILRMIVCTSVFLGGGMYIGGKEMMS